MEENTEAKPNRDYTYIYIRREDKLTLKRIADAEKRSLIDQIGMIVSKWVINN